MASDIHYSEGEFPLNLYAKGAYLNGFDLGMRNGSHWSGTGPLNNMQCPCGCSSNTVKLYVTDVQVSASYTLTISIKYSDGSDDTVLLEKGKKYKFTYLDSGVIYQIVGVITRVGKVAESAAFCDCECNCASSTDYLLEVDSSSSYSSSVTTIRTSNLRGISYYTEYEDEDTTIENATVRGATVAGNINNIRIKDATIDGDGNITAGTIVGGLLSETGTIIDGGSVSGYNKNNHLITLLNAKCNSGTIIAGNIVTGFIKNASVSNGTSDNNGCMTGCDITAPSAKIVAINCDVNNAVAMSGTLVNPVIENSIVVGGIRYGTDMVTVGGLVVGDYCYGGKITGGTLYGGTASGLIDDDSYTIFDGETTGGYTVKATVKGGKVVGGKQIGDTIIGAIVYGGTAENGTTVSGTTKIGVSGYIKPGITDVPSGITGMVKENSKYIEKDINDLVIWWNQANGVQTTLGIMNDTSHHPYKPNCTIPYLDK